MKCPICGSENYDFIDVDDFDEYEAILHFKCLGKCGEEFFGVYLMEHFIDNNRECIID